jgi:hypothetical protein
MRHLLLPLLLAATGASAYETTVDIPIGPAYSGLSAQVALRNREDYRPRGRDWRDRGLTFHDLIDNLRPPQPAKLMILVRRESDKPRAARAARRVLGKAAALVDPELLNVLTVDEYLEIVVQDLDELNKKEPQAYTVDFGALRDSIDGDLRRAKGAVYILRSGAAR